MRAILLGLILIPLAAVACSDRVPAPVTPTPSPRPGYPPAPVTALPEGVLLVQQPSSVAPLVFGITRDGEARPYVRTPFVSVSPDGSRGAAWTQENGLAAGIGILTGSGYEEIAKGPWTTGSPMSLWSADGSRLAYTIPDDAADGKAQVWTLELEAGRKRRVSTEADHYSLLGWTAAHEVLVRTPVGLALLGASERSLELPEAGEVVDVEISPDGRSLAVQLGEYEYRPEDSLTYVHSSGTWIGGLAGGDWRQVVDLMGEPPGVVTTGGQEMLWSPDGRRISTHLTRHDERGLIVDRLTVVDVRTGEATRVHERGWGWESWSPDGRYLAYMYEGNSESGRNRSRRLGILGPDGRTREIDEHPRGMAWAGNGRLLVDIPGKLSMLDPETMGVEEVQTAGGRSISVFLDSGVWSPSGRYVAAQTGVDAYYRSSLYVIDTETGTASLFLDEAGFSAAAWLRE